MLELTPQDREAIQNQIAEYKKTDLTVVEEAEIKRKRIQELEKLLSQDVDNTTPNTL